MGSACSQKYKKPFFSISSRNFSSTDSPRAKIDCLPILGRVLPILGSARPSLGNARPILGSALPMRGKALPILGNALFNKS
ncbi:hypothetical protein BpHYR1_011796 [Brachionus plicatilis]|uniref:Uncharacterized protein n=1 Tax=Brachionus plicatilis TaxID=10195 RepID=A0A3M7T9Y2_BRAPC|nr:hypothetical protein BpHYR1_011796 [Brachionus plicatilis]